MRIKLIKIIHHKFRLNDKIKNKLDFYKMIKKSKIKNKKISIKLKKKKTSKDGSMKLVTATLINLQVNFFFEFNVGVRASLRAPRLIPRASLRAPRLIPRALKLTTM
jgi:hypothetical protein